MPGSKNPPPLGAKGKTSTEKKTDTPRKTGSEKTIGAKGKTSAEKKADTTRKTGSEKRKPEVKLAGADGVQKGGNAGPGGKKGDGEKPSRDVVERNTTKLFQAIKRAQTHNMEEFIRLGANVNGRDEEGRTPIILAAELRNNTVQTLLFARHAVDVNASDKHKRTALHYESAHGDTDNVKQLLAHGTSIDTRDVAGRTPLHFAVNGNHFATADILVFCGADGTLKDKERVSPESLSKTAMMSELMKRSREITAGIKHEYITIERKALLGNHLVELESIGLKVQTPEMFSKSPVCFLCRRVRPEYSLTCLGPINSELLISDTFEFRISGSQFNGKVKVYIPMYDKPEPYEEVHIKTNIAHTLREDSVELTDYERLENSNQWMCSVDIDLKEMNAFVLVTRPRVEYFNVGSRGGQFVSEVDDFIKFDIPAKSFSDKGRLSLELIPRPAYDNKDLEVETIEVDSVSNFYDVSHTRKEQPQNDVTVTLPVPRDYSGDRGDLYILNRRDKEEDESELSLWEIICVNPKVTQGKITFKATHFCSYGMVSTREPRCDTGVSYRPMNSAAGPDVPKNIIDKSPGTQHEPEDKPQDTSSGGGKQSDIAKIQTESGILKEDDLSGTPTECQDASKQDTPSATSQNNEREERNASLVDALKDEENMKKDDNPSADHNILDEVVQTSVDVLSSEASSTGKPQIKMDTKEQEKDAGDINRQTSDLDKNNTDMKEPSRSEDAGLTTSTEKDTDNKSIKSVAVDQEQLSKAVYDEEKKISVETTHPGGSVVKVASDEEEKIPAGTTPAGGSIVETVSDNQEKPPVETTHPGESGVKTASDGQEKIPVETTHPAASVGKTASDDHEKTQVETAHTGGTDGKSASDDQKKLPVDTAHPGGSVEKSALDDQKELPAETTHPGRSVGMTALDDPEELPVETAYPEGSVGKVASDDQEKYLVETSHHVGPNQKAASDEKEQTSVEEEILNDDTVIHHSKAGSTTSLHKERSGFQEKQVGKPEHSGDSKPVDSRRESLSSARSGTEKQFDFSNKNVTSKKHASESSFKGSQRSIARSDQSVDSVKSKQSIHSQRTISRKEQHIISRSNLDHVSKTSSGRSSVQGSGLKTKESKKQQKHRRIQDTEVKKAASKLYEKAKKRQSKVSFVVMLRANETDSYETLVECSMKDPEKRVTFWKTEGFDDQKPSYPAKGNEYNIIPKTLFTFPVSGAADCLTKPKLEFHPKRKDDNFLIFSIRRINPDKSQASVGIRKMKDKSIDNAQEKTIGEVTVYLDGYDGKKKKTLKDAKRDSNFKGFTSDNFLEKIAKELSSEWYKLGIHLGLAKSMLDNSDEVKGDNKKLMMLILWRDNCRYRRDMGMRNLTIALRRVGRNDIEELVMQELKTWMETNKTRDDSFCTWLRAALNEDWIIPKGDLEPLSVAFMMSLVEQVGMEIALIHLLNLPTPQINDIEEDKRFFPNSERKMLEMLLQAKTRYQTDIEFFKELDSSLGERELTEAQEWCRNTAAEWCWMNGDNGDVAFVEQLRSHLDEVGHKYPPEEDPVDLAADAAATDASSVAEEQMAQ
ncbi:ankyrin repeat domain-containing protein 36A-like [Haliotis asinina]|uniref:ankyrin repeat domain-containing protein 36A-like n=1 Tax=Haliotis asinina TaxID=109174 RepID=UPI003531C890